MRASNARSDQSDTIRKEFNKNNDGKNKRENNKDREEIQEKQ